MGIFGILLIYSRIMSEFYNNDERLGRIPTYPPFMKIRQVRESRKNFICEFCNEMIQKGNSCQYWVGTDLGKFYYYRVCKKCSEC